MIWEKTEGSQTNTEPPHNMNQQWKIGGPPQNGGCPIGVSFKPCQSEYPRKKTREPPRFQTFIMAGHSLHLQLSFLQVVHKPTARKTTFHWAKGPVQMNVGGRLPVIPNIGASTLALSSLPEWIGKQLFTTKMVFRKGEKSTKSGSEFLCPSGWILIIYQPRHEPQSGTDTVWLQRAWANGLPNAAKTKRPKQRICRCPVSIGKWAHPAQSPKTRNPSGSCNKTHNQTLQH